jgi:hypothetical protein
MNAACSFRPLLPTDQALVLCHSCVTKIGPQLKITFPEEIMEWIGISLIKHSQPESVKLKVRGHKLRSILHRQGGH